MYGELKNILQNELAQLKAKGLYKEERILYSPQGTHIRLKDREVINFCTNNYLGLANHPKLIEYAQEALRTYGYGLSSVRFISGTQNIHKELEAKISHFLQTDDTILYSSCFDANGGLFETFLTDQDAVISDELNHASIIDGIRFCKAERMRYKNNDMFDLEEKLKTSHNKRLRLIATDGVFSMDGGVAQLDVMCNLAQKYNALVMIDDSHATGVIGKTGRGSLEYHNVMGKVDIITSTFGKALGGASGGFTSGRKEIIEYLRQKSRPYLFSNTLVPVIVATTIKVFELIENSRNLQEKLMENTRYFRNGIQKSGFEIRMGEHPIVPIMIGDAQKTKEISRNLLQEGINAIGFSYPVVPMNQARIRVQISAAHTKEDLDKALAAFKKLRS